MKLKLLLSPPLPYGEKEAQLKEVRGTSPRFHGASMSGMGVNSAGPLPASRDVETKKRDGHDSIRLRRVWFLLGANPAL